MAFHLLLDLYGEVLEHNFQPPIQLWFRVSTAALQFPGEMLKVPKQRISITLLFVAFSPPHTYFKVFVNL